MSHTPSHVPGVPRAQLGAIVILAVVLGACAASVPAPVETRTRPGATRMPPPPAPIVSAPAPAPAPASSEAAPVTESGVQTAPVRPSGVEVRPLGGAGAAPSAATPGPAAPPVTNLRREPRGVKRPYTDTAVAEMKAAEAQARAEAPPPPAPGAAPSAPAAPATPPPAGPTAAAPSATAPGPAAAPASASTAPAGSAADFAWPAKGRVLQGFGESRSTGITIAAAAGDPVTAVADGKVIFSGPGPRGYGNLVIVKHDADTLSVYGHGRALMVKEGQTVRKGQKIAEAGDSGTDKPKLLFEIRKSGKPVDPIKLLPAR